MLTRKELLLTILGEECNETAIRISKAIRFGLEEIQKGQDLTNSERIIYEFNDIIATIRILHEEKILPDFIDENSIIQKREKIKQYYEYSKSLGIVE